MLHKKCLCLVLGFAELTTPQRQISVTRKCSLPCDQYEAGAVNTDYTVKCACLCKQHRPVLLAAFILCLLYRDPVGFIELTEDTSISQVLCYLLPRGHIHLLPCCMIFGAQMPMLVDLETRLVVSPDIFGFICHRRLRLGTFRFSICRRTKPVVFISHYEPQPSSSLHASSQTFESRTTRACSTLSDMLCITTAA